MKWIEPVAWLGIMVVVLYWLAGEYLRTSEFTDLSVTLLLTATLAFRIAVLEARLANKGRL